MITIVNYGSGNIKAIVNIFRQLHIAHDVASSAQELQTATKVIIPGVGAFDQTMNLLQRSGFIEALNHKVQVHGAPALGICVGMQIMAQSSEEGAGAGLGWINGAVRQIDVAKIPTKPKLPHMGWNAIHCRTAHPIFDGVDQEMGFYFLHSYFFECRDAENVLATTCYGDTFPCAVFSGNIFGLQFHPEKSHANGVAVLKNFARL